MSLSRIFAPFSSRNYRLYFIGQVISLIGTWMTQTASLWLVYHLTASAFLLGVVGFASQMPSFLLSPLAGVWIDRANRFTLFVGTQVLSMLQSLALAYFALTNTITVGHLIGLSVLQGLINAVDMPVRQALVLDFVQQKENLSSAIALNSSMFNGARLVGPAIAGFVIAKFGAGGCYLVDGLSYLAVLAALGMMNIKKIERALAQRHPWHELREGFHYAFGFSPIWSLIVLVATISFLGFSYAVLMPIFARDIFGGDARSLGFLMAASGLGAILGAGYLGSRKTVRGLGTVISLGGGLMGAGLIGFALSVHFYFSMGCLTLVGLGGVLMVASCNTLLQTIVEDSKRGRVMSFFVMAFTGTMPLGNLVTGFLAGVIGAPSAVAISGLVCLGAAYLFYRSLPQLRAAAAPVMARLNLG